MKEINDFIESLVYKSDNTISKYKSDIKQFCDHAVIHNLNDLINLNKEKFNKYLKYAKDQQWSNTTLNSKVQSIKQLYRYLNIDNHCIKSIDRLPNDTKETRALTEDECNKILQHIKKSTYIKRNYVLFVFILDTGLRKFEYRKLRLSDIKENNRIYVEGKKRKKVTIFVTQHTMDLLKGYINTERKEIMQKNNESHDYVFVSKTGKQMDNTSFLRSIKEYARQVGIEDYKDVTVHGVRHSGLSIFYKNTKDIKATAMKARHTDPALTAKIYVHLDEGEFAKQVETNTFRPQTDNNGGLL